MSEFTEHSKERINALTDYMKGLIAGEDGTILLQKFQILTENFLPGDVLPVFDTLFEEGYEISAIKIASNKLFNILYKVFNEYQVAEISDWGYLYYLKEDNERISSLLKEIGENIKLINKEAESEVQKRLKGQFIKLYSIDKHYVSKENVLFSEIERRINNSSCLKLMWSFHDDIRLNIKRCIILLEAEKIDIREFNRLSAKVFFNIKTIIFREEKVLFPVLTDTFEPEDFLRMLEENREIGFAFIKDHEINYRSFENAIKEKKLTVQSSTGVLELNQLELLFKHLPVDLTYLDKYDKVVFYSNPPHRVFTRTKSIIGRHVQNCHPHESVSVVNKILDAFKQGRKDEASFWIKMGTKTILIRYFAIRDEKGEYEGTLEVTQDISEIQSITGEKRLLDWEE